MKAGPCGKEFSAWEACLDKCKKNGTDFIEHCGAPTLALRDCVDANPEYYHVLNDPPADEE
jgi:abnormal spindle-like microcephaly-associated protein